MIVDEFRPALSGKQSDENPDTSLLFNVSSEPPHLGSRPLFLTISDVRFGSIPLKNSRGAGSEPSDLRLLVFILSARD